MEVSSLARRMMLPMAQSSSTLLPNGLRFFHNPLPASASAPLAVRFPWWDRYGLTTFPLDVGDGLGPPFPPIAWCPRQERA